MAVATDEEAEEQDKSDKDANSHVVTGNAAGVEDEHFLDLYLLLRPFIGEGRLNQTLWCNIVRGVGPGGVV